MTYNEALFVVANRHLYSEGWLAYALDVIEQHDRESRR